MYTGEDYSSSEPFQLLIDGKSYPVQRLNSLGFDLPLRMPDDAAASIFQGELVNPRGGKINLNFRLRDTGDDGSRFRFHDLSLSKQKEFEYWIARSTPGGEGGSDGLATLSYDELASGKDTSGGTAPSISEPRGNSDSPASKSAGKLRRLIALLSIFLILISLGVILAMFVRTRSSIDVESAALLGNYVPITALQEGAVQSILVEDGQEVTVGDPLFRIENSQLQSERETVAAELETARVELGACELLISSHDAQIKVAITNLEGRQKTAEAKLANLNGEFSAASERSTKLAQLARSGAIARSLASEASLKRDSIGSDINGQKAKIEMIQGSLKAAREDGVLILGDRIDALQGEYEMKRSLASAKVTELERKLEAFGTEDGGEVLITAPREGRVFAIYKGSGEYVKEDDEVLSLSLSESYWAAGHVAQDAANSVRPGQSVAINIPSLGMKLSGKVAAVGHRAVYSKDGWSQDFRGQALSVPVKVQIDDPGIELPSGLRLKMIIAIGFRWPWQKEDLPDSEG